MLFPSPGGVGREGEQCADHEVQGFLQAFMKYLAFFKNLLGISLSCCLPTQMFSCDCFYCHPPIPRALEVQHCARMPEQASGSIAAIPQLPKPLLHREKHPAGDTDPLFCYPSWQQVYSALCELNAKRKVGEMYFEPTAHLSLSEIKDHRSQGTNNYYSHLMLCGTV